MHICYEISSSDNAFKEELESSVYPDGFAGFPRRKAIFVYEHQCLLWPWWGPGRGSEPTADWFSSGIGSVPSNAIKMRGIYEVHLYGLENWKNDVVLPNLEAWIENRKTEGYFTDPKTFTGDIVIDFETWSLFAIEMGEGSYTYFKNQLGVSEEEARAKWQRLVVGLYSIIAQAFREKFPQCKLASMYIMNQFLYQLDDAPNSSGAAICETGRKLKAEIQYQLYGGSPLRHKGGYAGWMLQIFRMFDYVDVELYNKTGFSTPSGAKISLSPGSPLINTIDYRDAYYYYRQYVEELKRLAYAVKRPLRVWFNPVYAVFDQGPEITITGLNTHDAEMFCDLAKSVGALIGLWMSYFPTGNPSIDLVAKKGLKDGLKRINVGLARYYGLPVSPPRHAEGGTAP